MKKTIIHPVVSRWTWVALGAVLLFAVLTRLYRLGQPAEFVFDERYHVPAIRLIAEHDPRAFEWWHAPVYSDSNFDWLHPPLAKYIQAGFFTLFHGTPFSWRIGSAFFGVMGVALTFLVAQLAFKKVPLSVLAAFLVSLDGLWLVQSRVAMNDVFAAVWFLAATAAYLWYQRRLKPEWLLLVGLFGGLGLATKWTAGWWLSGLVIWEVLADIRTRVFQKIPWTLFTLILIPIALYSACYLPLLWQGKSVAYIWELHANIVRYEWYGVLPHADQSQPWQWAVNLWPVWYWHGGTDQDIYALNNPLLAWLEVGAVVFVVVLLARQRRGVRTPSALALLVMLYALSFGPWFLMPRAGFYYHYTPAVPLAAVFLALWLSQMYLGRRRAPLAKGLLWFVLSMLVWVFWLYYPRWTGLPVSSEFSQAVYGLLPSWR